MLAIVEPIPSPLASWSRRIAAFSLQLILLTAILHRAAWLTTPMAINLAVFGFALSFLALLLGIAAIGQIWRRGYKGAWNVAFGIFASLMLFAWPALYASTALQLPAINDITTDTANPPEFKAIAKLRPHDANPSVYPGRSYAELQAQSYADVRPLLVPRSAQETFELVGDVVERSRWKIVAEHKPDGEGQPGIIEATDKTLILGFTDDIVIRVSGTDKEARIDARSASRFGMHDLGHNAERLRGFFKDIWKRLDESVGADTVKRKGRRDLVKRPKERDRVSKAPDKSPASARAGAPREPEPKARRRSRAESRDRDKP